MSMSRLMIRFLTIPMSFKGHKKTLDINIDLLHMLSQSSICFGIFSA